MKYVTLLILVLLSCDGINLPEIDVCKSCIDRLKKANDTALEIWSYQFENNTVYLIVPDCCDQYTKLYNNNCELICNPAGGITGKGDGKCPDFFGEATEAKLIWKK